MNPNVGKSARIEARSLPFFEPVASAYLCDLVRREIEGAGITYYTGGSTVVGVQRISFMQEDATPAMRVLANLVAKHTSMRVFGLSGAMLAANSLVERFGNGEGGFNIGWVVQATDNRERYGITVQDLHVVNLEVAFWRRRELAKGTFRFSTREHAQLGQRPEDGVPLDAPVLDNRKNDPYIGEPAFPIDVIYTWVDGGDPGWQRNRAAYSGEDYSEEAQQANRFRSRNELRYSLRSLEMYAPFVRKVFLVTSGQVPDWLNRDNERLELVTHEQIFRDPARLPTFNSSAIECCLHRIEGLAEHHLYMNDDFFFGRPALASTYFAPNGTSYYFPDTERVPDDVEPEQLEEYIAADRNVSKAFTEKFGFTPRTLMSHAPYAARVSRIEELEGEFPALFERCEASRFRHTSDIRPYAFMYQHYAGFRCWAVPGQQQHRYISAGWPNLAKILRNMLARRNWDTFVLNDDRLLPPQGHEEVDALIESFLESYFPIKSSFEK